MVSIIFHYMNRNVRMVSHFFVICSITLGAQRAVPPNARYHRVVALVHLSGSGKNGDAIRPDFAPLPGPLPAPASAASPVGVPASAASNNARSGILAWSMQLTDDRKMAIVHYVSVDRGAFSNILADARPEVRVFEIGKDSRASIETEMRKYKENFNLDTLQVKVQ